MPDVALESFVAIVNMCPLNMARGPVERVSTGGCVALTIADFAVLWLSVLCFICNIFYILSMVILLALKCLFPATKRAQHKFVAKFRVCNPCACLIERRWVRMKNLGFSGGSGLFDTAKGVEQYTGRSFRSQAAFSPERHFMLGKIERTRRIIYRISIWLRSLWDLDLYPAADVVGSGAVVNPSLVRRRAFGRGNV
ncbi:hypothetical protein BBL07_10265 [Agrobacterium vitis]|nr:hypothetical protein BBL07_10265 [Agrobacterium vitis]